MKRFPLLCLTSLAALLGAACAVSPAVSPGSALSAIAAKTYVAVPKGTPNPPANAVFIGRKSVASPAQVQVARKRVLSYLASLKSDDKKFIEAGRYVCVTTTPAKGHVGEVTCMSWDTQLQEFVGNNTYDLVNPPPAPSRVQFPTFTASYVGEGVGQSGGVRL